MSPIDQKTRPLKENHLIQRVLHRPVELAGILGYWLPHDDKTTSEDLA